MFFFLLGRQAPTRRSVLLRHTPSLGRFVGGNVALLTEWSHSTGGGRYILSGVLA